MKKSWLRMLLAIVSILVLILLVLSFYKNKIAFRIQHATRSGSCVIYDTQAGFFTQSIKNETPWKLEVLRVSFENQPEEIKYNGKLYVLSDIEQGVPVCDYEIPTNFYLTQKPIVILPNENKYLGVCLYNSGNTSATARNMILHCRIGLLNFDVFTQKHCTITPEDE